MLDDSKYHSPEIWSGLECTINRVGDRFFDQLLYSQHYKRDNDLNLIADLGIKKIRYPILWERHQPQIDSIINWQWTENKLHLLKEKNIDVIAGLVHHGTNIYQFIR
jgi:dTDP-4-dehydrorhamnose reductase